MWQRLFLFCQLEGVCLCRHRCTQNRCRSADIAVPSHCIGSMLPSSSPPGPVPSFSSTPAGPMPPFSSAVLLDPVPASSSAVLLDPVPASSSAASLDPVLPFGSAAPPGPVPPFGSVPPFLLVGSGIRLCKLDAEQMGILYLHRAIGSILSG